MSKNLFDHTGADTGVDINDVDGVKRLTAEELNCPNGIVRNDGKNMCDYALNEATHRERIVRLLAIGYQYEGWKNDGYLKPGTDIFETDPQKLHAVWVKKEEQK